MDDVSLWSCDNLFAAPSFSDLEEEEPDSVVLILRDNDLLFSDREIPSWKTALKVASYIPFFIPLLPTFAKVSLGSRYCVFSDYKHFKQRVLAELDDFSFIPGMVPKKLTKDGKFMLAAAKKTSQAVFYIHPQLKSDKKFMLALIEQYGWALRFASEELQNDPKILAMARYATKRDEWKSSISKLTSAV